MMVRFVRWGVAAAVVVGGLAVSTGPVAAMSSPTGIRPDALLCTPSLPVAGSVCTPV